MSPELETFVVAPFQPNSLRSKYRHYFWAAWRLQVRFGEDVAFLLDQDFMQFGRLVRRIVNSPRIFNSVGVVQLMLGLYTVGSKAKPGHVMQPGGLEHLVRVLPQLRVDARRI